ncbi:MAG: glycosyltransferase [Ignavibacteria bacterium]|nr:glycosyltransferase [Ignavibacteria bacterium]
MRKRILLVFHRIPYPPVGGDNLTNSNLVKILNQHFELDVIVVAFEKPTDEAIEFLKANTHSFKIFYYPKWRCILNSLRTIVNFKPLQVNFFYFPEVQRYINKIANDYDLLFAGIIRTSEYLLPFDKPKIINLADSIGLNYKYSYHRTKSLFWKTIYFLEYPNMLKYEKKTIEHYDRTLMFNKREIDFFKSNRIIQMPQAVKKHILSYEKVDTSYNNFVSYFGKMNYRPNVDAVLWFVENVFPLLPKEIKFQIVGANPGKKIIDLGKKDPRIIVRGFVEDPYIYLKSSLCVVAPMQTGGGIQNKILESMALGTIVITTPYSAFPIATQQDNVFLIAEEPREWAKIITEIFQNPDKFSSIKNNARNYIKTKFSYEMFENKLLNVIEEVLKNKTN